MLKMPLLRTERNEAAFQSNLLKGVIHSWEGKLGDSRFRVSEAWPCWQFNTRDIKKRRNELTRAETEQCFWMWSQVEANLN